VNWLVWDELAHGINKQSHGLPQSEILESLYGLVTAGLIGISRSGEDTFTTLTFEEVIDASNQTEKDSICHYRLTSAGGDAWESFASPYWNKFISSEIDRFHGGYMAGTITAVSPSLAISYLSGLHFIGHDIDHQQIRTEQLQTWQATYWKTLQKGFRIRYVYRDREIIPDWGAIPTSYTAVYSSKWYEWKNGT
jgi:hypothetical protein